MIRTNRRISMRLMAVLAGACTLALVACSSSSSSSSSASSTTTPSSSASAASKVTLVVYSAQGYDSAMTKAFTKATGIPVKLDDNSTGPLLTQIEAASGQINLALVQSSAAIGAALGDKNLGIAYLHPVTLLPSAIGIDAKAPAAEQAEAEKFIEFVLSPAGQKVMQSGDPTGDSLYYPVIQGVSPLSGLPSLASASTQTINPYTWGPQEGTINTWFDDNIVR